MNGNIYEIMLKDAKLAEVNTTTGEITICNKLPIGLYFNDNPKTFSDRFANLNSFQNWCAERVLMMSQKHAKKICNALALSQDMTTENKAMIALSYHCSTLNDCYWVRRKDEGVSYADVSLFRNTSENILTPVSLKGRSSSLFNQKLKNWSDIGVDGTLAKSWVREGREYWLYKECDNASGEVLAGQVLKELGIPHVDYAKVEDDGFLFTKCRCFTDEDTGFIPFRTLVREREDAIGFLKYNYLAQYADFVVSTYLIGNEDLHDKNWGVIVDGNGEIKGLAPMFDFDGCFLAYQGSKDLPFLPECVFLSDSGRKLSVCEFSMEESYTVSGPTLQEAAMHYAKDSSIDFDHINLDNVPVKYKEELDRRLKEMSNCKELNTEQEAER